MKKEGPFPGDWATATSLAGCWTATWTLQGVLKAPERSQGRGACLVMKEATLESGAGFPVLFTGTQFPGTCGGLGLYQGTPAR